MVVAKFEFANGADTAGFEPHPTDCTKFVQNLDGRQIVLSCPTNLAWNRIESKCDWAYNVPCPVRCVKFCFELN